MEIFEGGRIRGQVGINSRPFGGFGNRTLTYLSVRHIADAVDAEYFSLNSTDVKFVHGVHQPPRLTSRIGFRRTFRGVDTKEIFFLEDLAEWLSRGRTAVFKGPLLGEVLVRVAKKDSREFTNLRVKQCAQHQKALGLKKLVSLHLRAGDFREWEPEAILPAEFYIEALESLSELSSDEWQVRICVDDRSHPALRTVEDYLKPRALLPGPLTCLSPFECDLAAMAGSEFLVSSPSTFALIAGILGGPRVIHSAKWVSNRVVRGESFWHEVGAGTFPGFHLERLV